MKKLTLKNIKSGMLMGEPEKITVEIKVKGEDCEFDTFILPFSYDTAVAQLKAFGEKKEALAGILASVICDEKGELVFTETEIRKKFNQALVDAIWAKIVEINVLGKTSKLPQMTKSSSKLGSPRAKATRKLKPSPSQKSKNTPATSKNTEVSTSVDE